MDQALIENKLCIVSVDTLQLLFSKNIDSVALYMFYYKQCKLQKTNQSRTTDKFIMQGMGIGRSRLKKAKKVLEEEGLIEFVQKRNESGKFSKQYVKIKYLRKEAKQGQVVREVENPHTDKSGYGKQPTNALSYKSKMLKVNKDKCLKKYIKKDKSSSKQKTTIKQKEKDCEQKEKDTEFEKGKAGFYRKFKHLHMTHDEFHKLKDLGYSKQQIDDKIDEIENFRKNDKYSSLYLTTMNRLKRSNEKPAKEKKKRMTHEQIRKHKKQVRNQRK